MFGIGGFELFIILLFGFLIFGPDKLPEIARTVGAAIAKFKKAQEEMSAVLKSEVLEAGEEAEKKSNSEGNNSKEETSTPESFAERKARYDKERAERRRRQEIGKNRSAMKKESAEHARELEKTESPDSDAVRGSGKGVSDQEKTASSSTNQTPKAPAQMADRQVSDDTALSKADRPESGERPEPASKSAKKATLTADQLYGNVPIKPSKKKEE